jgi:pullulanase
MRQFMIESVKYWVDEYHIDGFRFDLMGVHDIETMNAIRAAVPQDIFIYGEGWSAGSCAYTGDLAMKANINKMPGIAAFSDEMRDALRGPWDSNSKAAFLGGVKGNEESIKFGIVGAIKHPGVDYSKVNYSKAPYANEPTQMIAYVSCHDDMCLVDRLKASVKGITPDELIRLDLLAQTAVLTSQGVPFLLSGEEMLRDKKGVHNSYESPDSINHLDWNNLERYPQVMEYYRNLIALRKAHPAFHMGSADMVRRNLDFLPTENCLVAYHINGRGVPGEQWGDIYVALNANKRARTIDIPEGTYTVVCRNIKCSPTGMGTIETKGGKVTIPAQSALILHN